MYIDLTHAYKYCERMFPRSSVYHSCMFPRMETSTTPAKRIASYNKMSLQIGRMIVQKGMNAIFSRVLWTNISKATAKPKYLQEDDGLHLSIRGKRRVVRKWLEVAYGRRDVNVDIDSDA